MFLGTVSAGLVALGLIAAATHIGTTFYAFGVVLLSTLSFVGFVTFERVLQSGLEDHGYAERIARLRAYYFDCAPEITSYLASVAPPQRCRSQPCLSFLGDLWAIRGLAERAVDRPIPFDLGVLAYNDCRRSLFSR